MRYDPSLKYDDSFCSFRCSVGLPKERDRTVAAKATIHTRQIRRSINSCLLILGAPLQEIYKYGRPGVPQNIKRHNPIGSPQNTIYERYTRSELLYWAENLYKDAVIKWHPDKHIGEETFYTAKCAEITEAYRQATRILSFRLH